MSECRAPWDGWELAKRVRDGWPATQIILTSGYSEGLLTARSVNEDLVLPEPYRPQVVPTTIRTIIGSSTSPA
ncbi:MAG: hypothetical protein JWM91_5122 [Rhodospirillales bacterium]|nr:hypothetical protein [Rhodospirillales bacterium]